MAAQVKEVMQQALDNWKRLCDASADKGTSHSYSLMSTKLAFLCPRDKVKGSSRLSSV